MNPQEKMAWVWLVLIFSLFYFSADAYAIIQHIKGTH
jgi:hypothetical protein